MAKFSYKMQNILDIKEKLEAQAKIQFSMASEKLKVEEVKLSRLYDDIKLYEAEIVRLNDGKLNISELKRCINSIEVKKEYIKEQIKEVNKAKKNLELARHKLNEVMVERKTHEKLKEKSMEKFMEAEKLKEIKEIDELVSYSYSINEKQGNSNG